MRPQPIEAMNLKVLDNSVSYRCRRQSSDGQAQA